MSIAPKVIEWYKQKGRRLPWRESTDPYEIWISEVILQQTRIAQGAAYYFRFLQRFPDIKALAASNIDDVLKIWEGLGYYSRARNLHIAAQQVMEWYGGVFPDNYKEILRLKGLGRYSARAVGSFAFGNPVGVVDGNVLRLMSRLLNDFSSIDASATANRYQNILDDCLQGLPSAPFNHGIMDIGSTICTPTNPSCTICPLVEQCLSFKAGNQRLLPIKRKKLKRDVRYFYFFWNESGGEVAVLRRKEQGLWGGLYEIPNEEVSFEVWVSGECKFKKSENIMEFKHVFTHFDMWIRVWVLKEKQNWETALFVSLPALSHFAFPKAVLKIIEKVC